MHSKMEEYQDKMKKPLALTFKQTTNVMNSACILPDMKTIFWRKIKTKISELWLISNI